MATRLFEEQARPGGHMAQSRTVRRNEGMAEESRRGIYQGRAGWACPMFDGVCVARP